MQPLQSHINLRIRPRAAEALYWELHARIQSYADARMLSDGDSELEGIEFEIEFREILYQLEQGLRRYKATAELHLERLRRITSEAPDPVTQSNS